MRGYKEEGTTTTPFDMVMMNDLDRYHLVMDVIDRVPGLGSRGRRLRQLMVDTRRRARQWTREHGEDLPEVRDWAWDPAADPGPGDLAVHHRRARRHGPHLTLSLRRPVRCCVPTRALLRAEVRVLVCRSVRSRAPRCRFLRAEPCVVAC